MKQLTFNFLRRQLLLIMAVIGFSTSMLANTTDVTYTEPTYTCDDGKDFENLTLRYATEMTLTCGENSDTWNHNGTRIFYNVLSDFTIDAKAGETVTANFKAYDQNYDSKNSEDLRWTIATLHIDWNRDGNFESSEIIAGKTGAQIGTDNDYQRYYGNREVIFDITKDIVIPEGTTPGKVRVRLNYTNAWIGNESVSAFATKSKEGIVYDFDINIVEPIESGLEVTWEQPENGTITVKNGTEVLESPATVESGTKLTIVPAPASGRYELGTLTANDTPITLNEGNYEVTINENTVIAATFDIAKYEINWNEPVNGTIKVVYANDESQEVTKGSKVQLDTELKVIAEPSTSGYVLNRVYYVYRNGTEYDITKGDNGYTFTVQETTNGINTIYINAVFEKVVTYLVSWAGEEVMQGGYLKVVYADSQEEVESDVTEVPEGSVLEIIPLPDEGYSLSALSYQAVGGTGASINIEERPYTFTVGGGGQTMKYIIISAEFTLNTYTLSTSVTPENSGSISVTTTDSTPIEGSVTHGQTIVITASENDGYKLQSLDVKGATKVDGQENQYTVEGDVTVTATFVEDAPVETWSEVTFDSMSGLSAEVDLSKYTYTGSWTKEAYGASEAVQMDDNSKKYGPFISKPESGNYFATKYTVEKKATYRFSFLHKRADKNGAIGYAKLCYATDLATMTESSETIEVPAKAGDDSGDLFQSQSITLEPGDYYFIYYISSASMSGKNGAKIRIADFKLEMLDGSAVEPTPEYAVTLNKPENGNLSVKYSNGEEEVTVSTEDATEPKTFNVAENTKLTVTVTPAEGYQLATLSPEMTEVEDSENVYEYTVTTEDVNIEATFEKVFEPYAQNFGQAVGNASNNRTWTNTVFDVESGEKTINVNYTTSQDSYDVYSDEFVNEENKVEIFADETFDLTVNGNLTWVYTLVYIDWNGDGVFDEEPANLENLGFNPVNESDFNTAGVSDTRKYSVKVPENAKIGETRARIVIGWKGARGFEMNSQEVIVGTTESGDPGQRKNAMARDFLLEIKERPQATMYNVTIKKPANGNLLIDYTDNEGPQTIETSSFTENSKVYSIPEKTVMYITVTPDSDYELDKILPEEMEEKTGMGGDTYYEYTVTGDATIEATFKQIQYGKISVNAPEETQGSIEIQLQNPMTSEWAAVDKEYLEAVEFDTELRAKVEAKTGYTVKSVMKGETVINKDEDGYYYFTVDAEEITISAEFEAEEYTLTTEVNPAEGGSVSVTVNGATVEGTVKYGDIITVTVTVNEGYLLESVVVEGSEEVDGQEGQYTVTGDVTITATFTEDTSSINSIENGTVYYNAEEEVLYTNAAKSVRVYDLSGRLVINAENQGNVSLTELAEGIYTAVVDGTIIKLNK